MERTFNTRLVAYTVTRVVEEVIRTSRSLVDLEWLQTQARIAVLDLLALSPSVTDYLIDLAARDVRQRVTHGQPIAREMAFAAD